jgi:two-component system chemotaxis response regulator CheB
MEERATGHDRIVIGASAGGVEALRLLIRDLPADIPAAVFIVMHVGRESQLAKVLARSGSLPVHEPRGGEDVENGQIYVAGPGAHLLLHDNHILRRRGPRENRTRPAIDPLFRSAAASFGGRVIGVILSGALNDGTAGLRAIKRCGGLAVVQDPADAAVPDMVLSALRSVEIDHTSGMADMAGLLTRLARQPAGPMPAVPLDIAIESAIAAQELSDVSIEDKLGTPSRLTCPECHGTLWEIEEGSMLRYRCHVGHAFTAETALSAKTEEIENVFGTLQRRHQERAALARRMAERERRWSRPGLADQLEARAREYEEDARLVRKLLRSGGGKAGSIDRTSGGNALQDEEPV